MNDAHIPNRWLVVVGALIVQVSLGAVYIWSVFQTPLLGVFPGWSESQVTLPAQIVIATFALAVIFGGQIQDRLGPRGVGTIGGLVLGTGLILAGLTGNFSEEVTLSWPVGTYAVLGGIGIGMAYVCPIATCVKWFPDRRGLITGLAVAGWPSSTPPGGSSGEGCPPTTSEPATSASITACCSPLTAPATCSAPTWPPR
jgi:OFA family oxalate/formate antiporter-like MFS transporter